MAIIEPNIKKDHYLMGHSKYKTLDLVVKKKIYLYFHYIQQNLETSINLRYAGFRDRTSILTILITVKTYVFDALRQRL